MSTPFLDNIYAELDFDRELAFKFFTVFSMFEYALKQAGYRPENKAEADWYCFAKSIEKKFNPNRSECLHAAVNYFETRPPMKQVVENGQLGFRADRSRDPILTRQLSLDIRRVRNNLFHGGKFRYERPRDTELLQHALVILEEWVKLDEDVHRELENALW